MRAIIWIKVLFTVSLKLNDKSIYFFNKSNKNSIFFKNILITLGLGEY